MHGIGNDFVVVDDRASVIPEEELPQLSRIVNDRRFGVGGDGLILLRPSSICDYAMRMFNPDGSEAEMCGNGIRCLAKFAFERGYCLRDEIVVDTRSGPLPIRLHVQGATVDSVTVGMGVPRWRRSEIPVAGAGDEYLRQDVRGFEVSAVSMGNPHAVVFVPDVSAVPLSEWGPLLETHESFPSRINVHFVEVVSRGEIIQRTWERGAGMTLACGTGACACVAVGQRLDMLDGRVTVHLPGGDLMIEAAPDGQMMMTGPAAETFTGTLAENLLPARCGM